MKEALEIPCPRCHAEPGLRCVGPRGRERKAFHRERGKRHSTRFVYTGPELPTESHIEKALAAIICGWIEHHAADATVATQKKIGPFRADIVVKAGDRKLAIECDGWDYHGSKEQVQRDKRRGRYFTARGYSVMRFTGSEITKDTRGCAAEVGLWIKLP